MNIAYAACIGLPLALFAGCRATQVVSVPTTRGSGDTAVTTVEYYTIVRDPEATFKIFATDSHMSASVNAAYQQAKIGGSVDQVLTTVKLAEALDQSNSQFLGQFKAAFMGLNSNPTNEANRTAYWTALDNVNKSADRIRLAQIIQAKQQALGVAQVAQQAVADELADLKKQKVALIAEGIPQDAAYATAKSDFANALITKSTTGAADSADTTFTLLSSDTISLVTKANFADAVKSKSVEIAAKETLLQQQIDDAKARLKRAQDAVLNLVENIATLKTEPEQ